MARLKEYNGHYCESEYEYAFIGFLEAEGWKYTSGNKLSRVTKRDVLIEDDFKKFIADGNLDLTEDEVTQIYDTVRLVGAESDFATLHKVYNWLVDGIQFTPKDGIARMIPLINFEKDGVKNIFRVVNQFTVEYTNNGQKENRRPDVILFVNGMPLCIMELKNPADANATIYDAWEQINIRYWRDIPHLLHYCPLACISDGVKTRLGTVRTPYEHFYAWRRVNDGDAVSTLPFAETETMIKGVYSPERFLEIFRDYIYFQDSIYDSDEVEIVCRYPQFFAARLLKQSIVNSVVIAGFVRKMSGTSEVDTDTMNRAVSKMVEEALKYNQVESVLESGEEEDIFSPEYFEKLSDVKMPATKLELLVKMLRKQIKEYGKVNQLAAKSFQEMLEKTIAEYHERRKHLTAEEAGEAQEQASEDIIKIATEQALAILRQMNENRESFRKIGLTFEEKAFYDILISLRDQYNFEYGTDKEVDGVIVNDKCKALAKKIKDIIDTKSSFADWLNNQNVRNGLKLEIKICLVKNGYPPQYSPEVFNKVMEQVENFEEYSVTEGIGSEATTSGKIYEYEPEYKVMMVAEDSVEYGKE